MGILDDVRGGMPAERSLTTWARNSRFAGSKDRAAVRDHVFDVLRAKRSLGDGTGRALMIALGLRDGWDMNAIFDGQGHAPAPLEEDERVAPTPPNQAAACDLPDWLWPIWQHDLEAKAVEAATTQQARASVFLRVNRRRGDAPAAIAMLAEDGIDALPHDQVNTAVFVTSNHRRVKNARAYLDGFVELQDAASEEAVAHVQVSPDARVLDYCTGYLGSDFFRFR
jgi:16S rRNA (cytosine967-C5)-methyltransferase